MGVDTWPAGTVGDGGLALRGWMLRPRHAGVQLRDTSVSVLAGVPPALAVLVPAAFAIATGRVMYPVLLAIVSAVLSVRLSVILSRRATPGPDRRGPLAIDFTPDRARWRHWYWLRAQAVRWAEVRGYELRSLGEGLWHLSLLRAPAGAARTTPYLDAVVGVNAAQAEALAAWLASHVRSAPPAPAALATAPAARVPAERVARVLWPSECPNCAYDLTGLPSAGRCPECGFDYKPGMIMVRCWLKNELPIPFDRGARVSLAVSAAIMLLAIGVVAVSNGQSWLFVPAGVLAGVLWVLAAAGPRLLSWVRTVHGTHRVLFSPSGVGFGAGLAQHGWSAVSEVMVRRPAPGLCQLRLLSTSQVRWSDPTHHVLDIVFRATPRQAVALRRVTQQWVEAARRRRRR